MNINVKYIIVVSYNNLIRLQIYNLLIQIMK